MLVTSSMFLLLRSNRNGFCTIDPQDAQTASMWVNPATSSSAIVRPSITVRDSNPLQHGLGFVRPDPPSAKRRAGTCHDNAG